MIERGRIRIYPLVAIFRDNPAPKASGENLCQRLVHEPDTEGQQFHWENCRQGSRGKLIGMEHLERAIAFAESS